MKKTNRIAATVLAAAMAMGTLGITASAQVIAPYSTSRPTTTITTTVQRQNNGAHLIFSNRPEVKLNVNKALPGQMVTVHGYSYCNYRIVDMTTGRTIAVVRGDGCFRMPAANVMIQG